jgi:hypothetical protein
MDRILVGACCVTVVSLSILSLIATVKDRPPTVVYVDEHGRELPPELAKQIKAERALLLEAEKHAQSLPATSVRGRPPDTAAEPTRFPILSQPRYSVPWGQGIGPSRDSVDVRGYTRRDGRVVAPHRRSRANHTERDNWTTHGNYNPYTGSRGSRRARR